MKQLFTFLVNLKKIFLSFSVKKRVVISIISVLLVFFGWRTVFGQKNQQPQYQTAQVERGTLITSVTGSGTISSGSSTSITSSATGVVKDVYVHNGDTVQKGDAIADITLDTDSLQRQQAAWANYLAAQNAVNAAQAKMNSLQSSLFKANQTFMNGAVASSLPTDDPKYIEQNADWLQAEADYKNQQGVIAQSQAALASSWLSYQQISPTIIAQSSGVVRNLTITPGMALSGSSQSSSTGNSSSSQSQVLGSIVLEGGQLQASVNLSEIDVTKVAVGQKATLTLDAFPDKTFTGRVSTIDTNGSVSSGVTTYPATITFDSALNTIYPNMAVTATIITKVKNDVLLVPSSAVQTSNGTSTVQVLTNGKVTPIDVEIGESNDTQTEITSGLSEGDTVVTSVISQSKSSSGQASPFSSSSRGFGGGFGGGGRTVTFQRRGN